MRHSTRWYIVNVWTKSKCEGQDYILFAVSLFSTNFIQIYISHRLVSVASFVGLKMWNGNHNGANYTQGRWNEIDELCAHNEKTEKKEESQIHRHRCLCEEITRRRSVRRWQHIAIAAAIAVKTKTETKKIKIQHCYVVEPRIIVMAPREREREPVSQSYYTQHTQPLTRATNGNFPLHLGHLFVIFPLAE